MKTQFRIPLDGDAYLRPLYEADVTQAYVDGLNDPDVNEFLVGPRRERQTLGTVKSFVRANDEDPHAVLFGLYVGERLRGTCRLHDIDPAARTANLGIALFDRSVWGGGWGSRVVAAVSGHAASSHGIEEVRAGIEEPNIASQKCFKKAGYTAGEETREDQEGRPYRTWIWRRA